MSTELQDSFNDLNIDGEYADHDEYDTYCDHEECEAEGGALVGGALIGGRRSRGGQYCLYNDRGPSGKYRCVRYGPGVKPPGYMAPRASDEQELRQYSEQYGPRVAKRRPLTEQQRLAKNQRAREIRAAKKGLVRPIVLTEPVLFPEQTIQPEGAGRRRRGGDLANKMAAERNPWLNYLRVARQQARDAGVKFDIHRAAEEYRMLGQRDLNSLGSGALVGGCEGGRRPRY